ncbi:MAG: exonuclease [Burkholderiales bacterium]|nr:MAG: exonuclease [Burkholderiales bacterium]
MSLSLNRLQALRRQSGVSTLSPLTPPVDALDPLQDQLARLRSLLRVKRGPAPGVVPAKDRTLPGSEIAPGLWLQEQRLPLEMAWPTDLDGTFDRREPIPTRDLLFFDTETTGLAGGTGTRAFMIGAADVTANGLRVRQLTISNTTAESAMLEAFRTWLTPTTILASYNGKSYDAPLLKTRYRLMRQGEPLSGLAHVDLLYPSRRRYRGVFENCKLATIERKVLGIVREDDLPGSEAPGAWLGYLRGGSAHLLRRVMEHNRQDVVTLARLAVHLSDG